MLPHLSLDIIRRSQKVVRRSGHNCKPVETPASQLIQVGEGNTRRPAYRSDREHAHIGGWSLTCILTNYTYARYSYVYNRCLEWSNTFIRSMYHLHPKGHDRYEHVVVCFMNIYIHAYAINWLWVLHVEFFAPRAHANRLSELFAPQEKGVCVWRAN